MIGLLKRRTKRSQGRLRQWRQKRQPLDHIIFQDGKLVQIDNSPLTTRIGAENIARISMREGHKIEVYKRVRIKIKLS